MLHQCSAMAVAVAMTVAMGPPCFNACPRHNQATATKKLSTLPLKAIRPFRYRQKK